MNKLVALTFLSGFCCLASAQTVRENILHVVEENSPKLKAMRMLNEASYWENRSGITLSDPEVGYVYQENFEEDDSQVHQFSVSQSLDFSVISGRKKKKALAQAALDERGYQKERVAFDLETLQLLDKLVFLRKMDGLYGQMVETNQQIVKLYESSLKRGDCSKLEYSRVRLVLADVVASHKTNSLELNSAYLRLVSMNGGERVDTVGLSYDPVSLPQDFEAWFSSVVDSLPVMKESAQQQSLCEAERKLAQSGWWPKLSAGYELEKTVGANAHSAIVGLSLPLWENRNSLKAAKLKSSAAEMQTVVNRQEQHDAIFLLYNEAQSLQVLDEAYHESLDELMEAQALMNKAVNAGELSLTDYLVEMATYYDLLGKLLDAEFKYQQAKTALLVYDRK